MSSSSQVRVGRTARPAVTKSVIVILLSLYAVVAVAPFISMLLNSLRTMQEMTADPLKLPQSPSLDNYVDAWTTASFGTYFFNSVLVTVAAVALSTLLSLFAAYGIARSSSKLMTVVDTIFTSGLTLPLAVAILPLFQLLDGLGLTDKLWVLVLVYAANGIPFTIFVLAGFVRHLPVELEEAARLDGAGVFRTFVHVMIPLLRPAIASVAIFRFIPIWNDFFYPLILIRDRDNYTIPVGLTRFFGEFTNDWPQLFAGLTIATIPLVVVYVFATKQILTGLTAGMSK